MKDRQIRLLIIALAYCAILVATGLTGNARQAEMTQEMRDIVVRYDLSVVDRVPPGVKPLVASTATELEQLLLSAETLFETRPALRSDGSTLGATIGTNCRRYSWREGGPVWYENLVANVYISSYGSFTWISSIGGVRFYVSGITLGLDLNDAWTDWQIDPRNAQCATISGGGVVDMFILIPDVIVFRSFPVEIYGFVNVAP